MLKILITDPLSEIGLNILKDAGFEILYKPKIPLDELSVLLPDIDGWIIRSGTKITSNLIKNSKKLQIIGRAGVGTDNIDIDCATKNGVIVMNVPDGNTVSAAEHTMALILSLSRNICLGHTGLMNGEWNRSNLVGKPLFALLSQKFEFGNGTVTLCHSYTKNLSVYTKNADIIIVAVGKKNILTEDMVKKDVVVIDVGINRVDDDSEKGYYITGDVDYKNLLGKIKAITPVPGGVGVMTVTMLLYNTVYSAQQQL